jgi:hypothetical protein
VAKGCNGTLTNYVMANLMGQRVAMDWTNHGQETKEPFPKWGRALECHHGYTHNARCVPHANMFYFGGFVSLHPPRLFKNCIIFCKFRNLYYKRKSCLSL